MLRHGLQEIAGQPLLVPRSDKLRPLRAVQEGGVAFASSFVASCATDSP
jgi:hypothetical protein